MTGIRTTPTGYHAYVRAHGRVYAKRFPLSASLDSIRAWRRSIMERKIR